METVEFRLTGNPEDASELVRVARASGLEASSDKLIMNTEIPPPAEIIAIAGALAALTRCINTYLRERKRRLEIITPEMHIYSENFTEEQLAGILKKGAHIGIKMLPPTPPNKGAGPNERERGQAG